MPCSQVVPSTEAGWDLRAVSLVYLSEIPSRLVQQKLETPPGQDLLCALRTERPPSPVWGQILSIHDTVVSAGLVGLERP